MIPLAASIYLIFLAFCAFWVAILCGIWGYYR